MQDDVDQTHIVIIHRNAQVRHYFCGGDEALGIWDAVFEEEALRGVDALSVEVHSLECLTPSDIPPEQMDITSSNYAASVCDGGGADCYCGPP